MKKRFKRMLAVSLTLIILLASASCSGKKNNNTSGGASSESLSGGSVSDGSDTGESGAGSNGSGADSTGANSTGNNAPGSKSTGTNSAAQGGLSWLDTSGNLPIVKKGTQKTLKIAAQMYDDSGPASSQWFYKFIEKEMNIKLDITKFSATNAREYLSLMLMDGDLPDIIIGGGFGTADLMNYGSREGLFADLAPYITQKGAPYIYELYKAHPEYKKIVTDTKGRVWSLGYINERKDRAQISRAFLNYDWMEDAGLSTPQTLDEFVDLMRAFKKRGGNIVPMGGSYSNSNPCLIILNALGYITENPQGMSLAMRNGKIVFPVADREAYGEFLKVMNKLYTEGLIDKNFYTMDAAATRAVIAGNRTGYITSAPFTYVSNFTSWWGALPLTSSVNGKRQWPVGDSALTTGGFVLSAKSKNKELAMAFANWFFDPTAINYNMSVNGPAKTQTQYIYDNLATGFTIDAKTFIPLWPDYDKNKNKYSSKNDYLGKEVYLWGYRVLGIGKSNKSPNLEAVHYGYSPDKIVNTYPNVGAAGVQGNLRTQTAHDGEVHFRSAMEDTMVPYLVEGFPSKVYLDAETSNTMGNLMTIIQEYATQESAKFVTGRRPLSELNSYFNEIEKLGAKEVLKTYTDYYNKNK